MQRVLSGIVRPQRREPRWSIARTSSPWTYSIVKKYELAEPADVVDLRDVRVVELRGEPRLVEEHRHELRVAEPLRQDPLEHDVRSRPAVARARNSSAMPPVASRPSIS